MSNWQDIQTARYISLSTQRKSGAMVNTPVWAAPEGEKLYAFSAADAGKVKRLRNFAAVRVAVCDARGKLLGDWMDAQAHITEDANEIATALQALRRRYGWQIRMTDFFSKLSGRYNRRAYIRITAPDPALAERQGQGQQSEQEG